MEVKSQDIPEDLQIQGNTRDRSFCFSNLTSITHLHLMEIGPLQPRERCLPNILDQQKGICLCPILSNRSGLRKDSIGPSNTDSSNPRMANTVVVPSASANVNKESLATSKYSRSFDRTKQTKSSVERKPKLATPGMDSFRENLSAEGLSEESAILIANDRRPGIVSHYESACGKSDSWCVRRKIDSIRYPMRDVVQFLTEFFQEGFKYNTIAGFRLAISDYHDPIQGIPVSKHPRVSDLLTGIPRNPSSILYGM